MTTTIDITPHVRFTRVAQKGQRYLLEIDLTVDSSYVWAFEEEEITIGCSVSAKPFFSSYPIDDGDIVLHRFGGSYGPARFVLTAKELGKGSVVVTLISPQGRPLPPLKLPEIVIQADPVPDQNKITVIGQVPTGPTIGQGQSITITPPPPATVHVTTASPEQSTAQEPKEARDEDVPPTKERVLASGDPLRLFISYSSSDAPKVDKIASDLALLKYEDGTPRYTTWQDKHNLPPGHPNWWDAILDAIDECPVFIFHISRLSLSSVVCMAELEYAHSRNRPIIPVVLDGEYNLNEISGKYDLPKETWAYIPEWLGRTQFLFYAGTEFYSRFERVMDVYRQNWPRELSVKRPLHPDMNDARTNHARYAQACDYAERLAFSEARRLFEGLVRRNDPTYANEAAEWLELLSRYDELIEVDSSPRARFTFKRLWEQYIALFPKAFFDGIFDPKGLAERINHFPVITPPPKPTGQTRSRRGGRSDQVSLTFQNHQLTVEFGDLFKQPGIKVIPVSRYMHETSVIASSLQAQVIKKYTDDDRDGKGLASYISSVEAALANKDYVLMQRDPQQGGEKQYPVGTLGLIQHQGEKYLLLATTETERRGHIPQNNFDLTRLMIALESLWDQIPTVAYGDTVNIPLLGTGISGLTLTPTEALSANILTILNAIRRKTKLNTSEIKIVIHKSRFNEININILHDLIK